MGTREERLPDEPLKPRAFHASWRAGTIGLACVLAFVFPALGQTGRDTPARPAPPVTFSLDNGLRVAIVSWAGLATVHVTIHYPASPAIEPPGQDGIAHVYEHLMFTSSPEYPNGGLRPALELATCSRGGSTRPDHSLYESECIPALLPDLLRVEASRMAGVAPTLDEFEREKGVVLEEIAWRSHYAPSTDLSLEVFRASFPGHPYGRPVGGTIETVRELTPEDLREFGEHSYGPVGAVLVVVGDLELDPTRALIEDLFGEILPRGGDSRLESPPVTASGDTVVLDRFDLEGHYAAWGVRLPRSSGVDRVRAQLLRSLLDHEHVRARLWTMPAEYFLSVTMKLGYRRTDWAGNERPVDAEEDARRAHERIWDFVGDRVDSIFTRAAFEPFVERALERAKASYRDPETRARSIGVSLLHGDDPAWLDELDESAGSVAPDTFKAWITEHLASERVVFGVSHGIDSGRIAALPSPGGLAGAVHERARASSTMPDSASIATALRAYREHFAGAIETRKLSRETPVHLVPNPGSAGAIVGAMRTFPALDAEKRGKKRGLSWAYDWLVDDPRNARRAASEERPRIRMRVHATPSEFVVTAESTKPRIRHAAEDVAAFLDLDGLDRGRWRRLHRSLEATTSSLQRRSSNRAKRARWKILFDEKEPVFGHLVPLPHEALKVGYRDLEKNHESLTRFDGTDLFIVAAPSAFDSEVLEAQFGDRKRRAREKPRPVTSPLDAVRGEIVSDFDKKDVELALTFPPVAVERTDASLWAAATLARAAIADRLRRRLREEEGLVYFASASFEWVSDAVLTEITTGARPRDVARVYELVREELASLGQAGITGQELDRARLDFFRRRARWAAEPSVAAHDVRSMLRFGPVPRDPALAIAGAPRGRVVEVLRALIPSDRFAFTIRGPLLEEEISRFPF